MKNLLFALLIMLLISCGEEQESAYPEVTDITESVYASGFIESKNQYNVFSTVNGILDSVFVSEGDVVEKDQILFSLQNTSARLQEENARIAAEYQALENNRERLRELEENIEFTKAKYLNDSTLFEKQKRLLKKGVGSANDLDQRELAFKNSKTAYESAKLRYDQLKKQLQFNEKQSRKNLQINREFADDFVIRSKINGKVYSLYQEQGELVGAQSPLAVLGSDNEYKLVLQIDEYDIVEVKKGQKVIVTLDSYKGKVFEAEVTLVNQIMNEKSRTFTVEAEFTKPPPSLFPNLTLEANIIIQSKKDALTVPRKYLIKNKYLLVGEEDTVKVKLGLKDYEKTEITEGISKDDKIYMPVK